MDVSSVDGIPIDIARGKKSGLTIQMVDGIKGKGYMVLLDLWFEKVEEHEHITHGDCPIFPNEYSPM